MPALQPLRAPGVAVNAPRRRYVLTGKVAPGGGEYPRFEVEVHRGKALIGTISVMYVGTPGVTVTPYGLGELPEDHRAALVLLASRGFTGSWSPAGRAPSTSPSRIHHTPLR